MSTAEAQEAKSLLLRSNNQFRQLAEQHHELDDLLHKFTDKSYLSDDEQLEEMTLKKRKLALKDQMEQMALDYARAHFQAS